VYRVAWAEPVGRGGNGGHHLIVELITKEYFISFSDKNFLPSQRTGIVLVSLIFSPGGCPSGPADRPSASISTTYRLDVPLGV
jgi:hypothetical protein